MNPSRHLSDARLESLEDLIISVVALQDYDAMQRVVVDGLASLFNADDCYITRWDLGKQRVYAEVRTSTPGNLPSPVADMGSEHDLTASALKEGQLVIEDVQGSPYSGLNLHRDATVGALLVFPMVFAGYQFGAVILIYDTPRKFDSLEIQFAERAVDQVTLVLWEGQKRVKLEENIREATTLANIARTLSETEHMGLKSVLQLIVTSVKDLIPKAEQTVIHILDADQQFLIPEAVSGFDHTFESTLRMRLGEGVAGQVLASGVTVKVDDVETDSRFIYSGNLPKFRSLIVAPVQSGTQKLGTISVQNAAPHTFTEDDSQLLSSLGTQAANACLLEMTKASLKETSALYRINQELVASTDPDHLMQDVVDLLQESFGYYYVQIFVADPKTGDFIMRAGSGSIGDELKKQGYRLAAGEGIVGYTAETGDPFFTNNVDVVVTFVRPPLLPDTKSELAVPIKVGEQMLGLLDVHQMLPISLTQRDVQLVSAVADQLAVALQKANLYADLQNSLRQEQETRAQLLHSERLAVVGRLLASVSHELNNPLQAIQNALFLIKEERGISEQGRQDLNIVLSEAERMANLLAKLRTAYRPAQKEDFRLLQVNQIIEDIFALVATHLRHNQITFEFYPEPTLPMVNGVDEQLRQVFLNLFMNAVDAMPTGGHLRVSTSFLPDENKVLATVSDTGRGISQTIMPNIFDAFVTSKDMGTGLGLTITNEIVLKHRGHISAENNPDHGAKFNVWLPAAEGETE